MWGGAGCGTETYKHTGWDACIIRKLASRDVIPYGNRGDRVERVEVRWGVVWRSEVRWAGGVGWSGVRWVKERRGVRRMPYTFASSKYTNSTRVSQ